MNCIKNAWKESEKDVDANSDELQLMNDEHNENSDFNPNLMLEKLMEEKLLKHMKGEILAHVPSVIEAVRDAFHEYVKGLNYVNDLSKSVLEKALQSFMLAHSEYAIHTMSKKEGRLVYNLNWGCISNLYDISKTKKDNNHLKFDER